LGHWVINRKEWDIYKKNRGRKEKYIASKVCSRPKASKSNPKLRAQSKSKSNQKRQKVKVLGQGPWEKREREIKIYT